LPEAAASNTGLLGPHFRLSALITAKFFLLLSNYNNAIVAREPTGSSIVILIQSSTQLVLGFNDAKTKSIPFLPYFHSKPSITINGSLLAK
jgi:hypothetical protein